MFVVALFVCLRYGNGVGIYPREDQMFYLRSSVITPQVVIMPNLPSLVFA